MSLTNLTDLYHYLDQLVCNDISDDELFASSYLRGFISLSASEYGDETQLLSVKLADSVSEKLRQARSELSPQDREIVLQYWQTLQKHFSV